METMLGSLKEIEQYFQERYEIAKKQYDNWYKTGIGDEEVLSEYELLYGQTVDRVDLIYHAVRDEIDAASGA